MRGFCPDIYKKNTPKEMDKSFVNTVQESLIKPTPAQDSCLSNINKVSPALAVI